MVIPVDVQGTVAGRMRDLVTGQLLLGGMSCSNLVYPYVKIIIGNVIDGQDKGEVDDCVLI